jgi:ribonuclease T2
MNRRIGCVALALLLCMLSLGAWARHHHPGTAHPPDGQAGQFDYYVLALSWSPTYCLTHAGDVSQCGRKGYGFVMHGLWPQYAAGGYPQTCVTDARLTGQAIAYAKTLFPSPTLVEHEWSKHGTCSGLDAIDYFKAADSALAHVKIPDAMQAPRTTLTMTASEIAQAFTQANPDLRSDGIAVACSGPELSEVRVCIGRNLAPTSCGKGVKTACRPGAVRIRSIR